MDGTALPPATLDPAGTGASYYRGPPVQHQQPKQHAPGAASTPLLAPSPGQHSQSAAGQHQLHLAQHPQHSQPPYGRVSQAQDYYSGADFGDLEDPLSSVAAHAGHMPAPASASGMFGQIGHPGQMAHAGQAAHAITHSSQLVHPGPVAHPSASNLAHNAATPTMPATPYYFADPASAPMSVVPPPPPPYMYPVHVKPGYPYASPYPYPVMPEAFGYAGHPYANQMVEISSSYTPRTKMKRFRLTHAQTRFLMSEFAKQPHPDAAQRERLVAQIPGLSTRQVQVWFQNRRAKLKRMSLDDRNQHVQSRSMPSPDIDADKLEDSPEPMSGDGAGPSDSSQGMMKETKDDKARSYWQMPVQSAAGPSSAAMAAGLSHAPAPTGSSLSYTTSGPSVGHSSSHGVGEDSVSSSQKSYYSSDYLSHAGSSSAPAAAQLTQVPAQTPHQVAQPTQQLSQQMPQHMGHVPQQMQYGANMSLLPLPPLAPPVPPLPPVPVPTLGSASAGNIVFGRPSASSADGIMSMQHLTGPPQP
ncbi:uncharacterized protein V1510DRAFT_419237, partial [Dipodascopsis tothii]|uniref:uncharacterized protein n=1 Tax=Dipodascopsis tothii TaxID=44089 RepID=UPI0034CE1885